ncbi:MAG: phosphatase PAP2 family protein, partial [Pseudomonadota bacterium]
IIAYGITLIAILVKLKIKKQNIELQKKLLFLISALIFIPLIVASLKHYSHVHCPHNIYEFGGGVMHVSPLDIFKEGVFFANTGKCFPAGHASGGFALISLYFVLAHSRLKFLALFGGLSLGSIMGLYQISKGVHYLSDTIATAAISYLVCITLYKFIIGKDSAN